MQATCVNDGCTEESIAKAMDVRLLPGEMVICGGCGEPCELTED